jgi:hypothetical protein
MIASAVVPKEDVYHSVFRRPLHITLLARVSTVGDEMAPLLITSTPVRDCVENRSLRQSEDPLVRQRSPADVCEQLFFEYISNVFIPYIDAVRNDARWLVPAHVSGTQKRYGVRKGIIITAIRSSHGIVEYFGSLGVIRSLHWWLSLSANAPSRLAWSLLIHPAA